MLLQMHMERCIHNTNQLLCSDNFNVIQDGTQPLTLDEFVLQSSLLAQREKERHQRITLLTTFTLHHVVDRSNFVFPRGRGMITSSTFHTRCICGHPQSV